MQAFFACISKIFFVSLISLYFFSFFLFRNWQTRGDVWTDTKMPVIDNLGDEFLEYVKTGMTVTIKDDGVVVVE